MEAVVRDFGDRNPQEDPVIHFYELFLKEYDAKKRMQRGVFYTPRPVVSYIVRSVDELLRTEFGLADGLADTTTWGEMAKRQKDLKIPYGVSPDQDFVQILDPATGTGTFLVEVIDLIHKTLVAKWKGQGHGEKKVDALWNEYVPKHLLTRLHGYELLMAPYAIAHLKIGLKLYETGYRFGSDERARVYLTNALEPAGTRQLVLDFLPALAHEAQAVDSIKRNGRFLAVIGNPPYAQYSMNLNPSAQSHIEKFRFANGEKIRLRNALQLERNLNDDYVKFLGFSTGLFDNGPGLLGMITNRMFLDSESLVGLREWFATHFDVLRIVDLWGSNEEARRVERLARDENVFDIQQGVAISFAARTRSDATAAPEVKAREVIGARSHKYRLLGTDLGVDEQGWTKVQPDPGSWWLSRNTSESAEAGFALPEIFPQFSTLIASNRDHLVVGFDREEVVSNVIAVRAFHGSNQEWAERFSITLKTGWNVDAARKKLRSITDVRAFVRPIEYRAYDRRWIFFDPTLVWQTAPVCSGNLRAEGNRILVSLGRNRAQTTNGHWVSASLVDKSVVSTRDNASGFPLYLHEEAGTFAFGSGGRSPNLSPGFLKELSASLGLSQTGQYALPMTVSPEDVLHYVYSVLHSPGYRSRYAASLVSGFPRIPLVAGNLTLFRELTRLGGELVPFHLLESPKLAKPITEFIGSRNPEVEKVSWTRDTVWIDKAQTTGFKGVREDVWNFHIGGYQVCEKWLKDRKGRTLSKDDIAHYQKIVVALSETIRLMKEIDEVIEQHGGWPGAFQTGEAKAAPVKVIPFRPRTVEPKPAERYVACVPLVPLKAAAGAFGDPQHIEDEGFEWVAVESTHRLRSGMFVAQVVGKSMEPAIPDGAWCLFRAPVEGTRQGKTVLVQLRDATDPETSQRYTVKRYESEKSIEGDLWHHERITLKPMNADFPPIVLAGRDAGELQVVAEVVEVLDLGAQATAAPSESGGGTESVESERLQQPEIESAPGKQLHGRTDPSGEDSEDLPPTGTNFDADDLPCQIRSLFADGKPRDRESAIRELREQLGFKRTGHVLREALDNGIRTAVRRGILGSEGGVLKLHLASIDDLDRDFLKDQFLASLGGRAWRERTETARVLARFLGFRRTGPAIEDAVRSIINGLLREGRLEARASEIRRID
jgi:SOS-response transcriptional repressor LexA